MIFSESARCYPGREVPDPLVSSRQSFTCEERSQKQTNNQVSQMRSWRST